MFFSSFFALFSPPYWRNHNFGRKISKNFAHTQARNVFFLIKSHILPLFALFFAFSTVLTRATYRALPDLQRSELPTTARPASDLLSPSTLPLSTTVDIRLIYGTYTVDTRYISIFTPYPHRI